MVNRSQFYELRSLDRYLLEALAAVGGGDISMFEGINSIEPADFVAITKLDYSQIKKIWEMSNRDVLAASWEEPHLEGVSMMKIYGIWNIGRSLLEELSKIDKED